MANQNDVSNGASDKSPDNVNGTENRPMASSRSQAGERAGERGRERGRPEREQTGGRGGEQFWRPRDGGQSLSREGYGEDFPRRGDQRSDAWDWRYGPETGVDLAPSGPGYRAERDRADRERGAPSMQGAMRSAQSSQSSQTAQRAPSRGRWRRSAQAAGDVMTRTPKCVKATDPIQQISQIMVDEDTGIVPVVDEHRVLLGVVTDRDIVCRLIARGGDPKTATARDVMTEELECVTERDSLDDVLRLMGEHQVRRVPVVAQGDRLVGIISMADLAREADVDERLQDTFEDISSERSFWSRLR